MRLSPFESYDVRVSVTELRQPSVWDGLRSNLVDIQAAVAGRLRATELSSHLRARGALHLSVLGLAAAVIAGGQVAQPAPKEAAAAPAAAGSNSLALSARAAIVARTIPLTSQNGDGSYMVQPGDTLSSIARQVGVNEEAILAFNGLSTSDALSVGLQLRIPDLSKVPPEQLRVQDTAPHDATPPVRDPASEPLPPQKPGANLIIHTVRKGDSASSLAAQTGVSEASILASNNLQRTSILSIGQTLVIPLISGRLVATKVGDTVDGLAQEYSGTRASILAANKFDPRTEALAPDQLVLVPSDPDIGAAIIKPAAPPPAPVKTEPAPQARPVQAPAAAPEVALAKPAASPAPRPASSPGFIWPAPGYISTYFSSWHNGIDIVSGMGTPVHAAQAGRVVFAGWDNSGYGYMVRIDHGNGLQTLYGHASRLLVKAGESVSQGQVIMLVGSTGRSTGPHVHFSVFQGGGYSGLNPLKYLP